MYAFYNNNNNNNNKSYMPRRLAPQ